MKYILKPIGPNGNTFKFDTNDIFHLSKLGRSDEGVVYFGDVPYTIESKPERNATPDLLALLEKIDNLLAEWKNLNYINYGKMKTRFDEDLERVELEIEETIATAKGVTMTKDPFPEYATPMDEAVARYGYVPGKDLHGTRF